MFRSPLIPAYSSAQVADVHARAATCDPVREDPRYHALLKRLSWTSKGQASGLAFNHPLILSRVYRQRNKCQ